MSTAVVIGSSGGLGRALSARLAADPRYDRVLGFSRNGAQQAGVESGRIDLADPASIAAAAVQTGSADLVIVATGRLHGPGLQPERSLRELTAESLLESFRINAVGPALVAQAFLPLLPRDKPGRFAALSARVGSISENRLGGWHSYRASKAALNMLIQNIAIELKRTRPLAICVGLHPGTVDTPLSEPFQRGVKPGALFTPDHSAACLLSVLDGLTPDDSGHVFAWDGARIAP